MKSIPVTEDDALRERMLMRSQAISIDRVTRLTVVADDLAAGAASRCARRDRRLRPLTTDMRSFLLLLR